MDLGGMKFAAAPAGGAHSGLDARAKTWCNHPERRKQNNPKPRPGRVRRTNLIPAICGPNNGIHLCSEFYKMRAMMPNAKLSDRRRTRKVERAGSVRSVTWWRAEKRGDGSSPASGYAIFASVALRGRHALARGVDVNVDRSHVSKDALIVVSVDASVVELQGQLLLLVGPRVHHVGGRLD